jgi:hypothetical protein
MLLLMLIDICRKCLDHFKLLEDHVDVPDSGVYTDCKDGSAVAGQLVLEVSNGVDNAKLCQVVNVRVQAWTFSSLSFCVECSLGHLRTQPCLRQVLLSC